MNLYTSKGNMGEAIKCLRADIVALKDELNAATKSAGNLQSSLGSSSNVLKDMKNTLQAMGKEMLDFATSTGKQYALAEKIAKSYKQTAISIGLSVSRSADLAGEFKGALTEVSKFGGEMSDVQDIYKNFADSSGRVRILEEKEVANIFKLGEATDLYGSEAADLYETLDLMGISNVEATKRMVEMVKDSQGMGLNAAKVTKLMANNMKTMQSYSFAGGVKGMTQMAKQAVKMRIDVSDVLGMAEKFYEPEAALEAAANLQMLGGDIATAFGDPFETMYLARNKPEELANRLEEMTQNMLTFNEATGEYDLPAEARMQLKTAGDQLGINTEKMVEMARQASKIKDVKMELQGGAFSDDELEGIASLARMEDGDFKVDFRDEAGNKVTKSIDRLTSGDAKLLLETPQNETEYFDEMLYEAQTTNERLQNIENSFKAGFIADMDIYKAIEDATGGTLISAEEMGEVIKDNAKVAFDKAGLNDIRKELLKTTSGMDKEVSSFIDTLNEQIKVNPLTMNGGSIDISGGVINFPKNIKPDVFDPTKNVLPDVTQLEKIIQKTSLPTTNTNVNFPDPLKIHVTADPGVNVTPETLKATEDRIKKNLWDKIQQRFANGSKSTGKEVVDTGVTQ